MTDKKCGAETSRDGGPCERPAGEGTVHPGEGFCYHHQDQPEDGKQKDESNVSQFSVVGSDIKNRSDVPDVEAPDRLVNEARTFWQEIAPILQKRGVLEPTDKVGLLYLSMMHNIALQACDILIENGVIEEDSRHADQPVKHPAFQIARDSISKCLSIMEKYGLTPKDRKELGMFEEEDEEDAIGEIISDKKGSATK